MQGLGSEIRVGEVFNGVRQYIDLRMRGIRTRVGAAGE